MNRDGRPATPCLQQAETESWRVLLFGREGAEMLLFRSPSGFRLPELRIPRSQRVAPNLNAEAKRLWNLDTVCLMPLNVSRDDSPDGASRYHLMEVHGPDGLSRLAPDFMQLSGLRETSFADPQDYLAVRKGMEPETTSGSGNVGPLSRFGTFGRIAAWVEEQLEPLGLRWDRTFRQLQATDSFSLIRFPTNRGAVWFKATGEPNRREFPLTLALGRFFPGYMPIPLATNPEWNAWLAFEAEGRDLWSSPEPDAWFQAADSFADLQIASTDRVADVLNAGAHDARLEILLHKTAPFFSAMEGIMEMQTKPSPCKLHRQEIRFVQLRVVEALELTGTTEVPDSLNHLDLNPGNVLVHADRSTFLDWAEATVGNPFFSCEYLRQHFRKAFSRGPETEERFEQSYLKRWRSLLPRQTIETMLRVVPLTAIYAFAASALPWHDPNLSRRREVAAYLRSLVRRMYRESELFSGNQTA